MGIRPTFFGIEIARTGLTVSQKGLDVTGHNIANVDTLGYTRQRLVTTAYEPYSAITQFRPVEAGLVGSGAHVMILDQIRSSFLDRQFRSEQSILSNWETRTQGLTYVESMFEGDYDEASLSEGINGLFSAFLALSKESNDREQRKLLQQNATTLCQNFNLVYTGLVDLQAGQNLAIENTVNEINSIAENIAMLNKSIYAYELDGERANDLRDKRNLLLDQLSALVDIDYSEDMDNKLTVTIGGDVLVSHLTVNKLECVTAPNPIDGEPDISVPQWMGGGTLTVTGGSLRGHLDLRDGTGATHPGIPYFVEQLNTLVRALVQEVNAVHSVGYTHPSNPSGLSDTGQNFFDDFGDISLVTAKNIKLDDLIIESEFYIAASTEEVELSASDPTKLQAGNQENARALYNLINLQDIILSMPDPANPMGPPLTTGIGGFFSYMSGILVDVASTLSHSKKMAEVEYIQASNIDNQRTSISGVSLDEEMTNLIKYQHAYAGSSRVITAMDEALETIINKMGLVGRS